MCETKKSTNVKMIDFGLATKLNPDEIVKVTTATAEFAAPEIVDSEPIISTQTCGLSLSWLTFCEFLDLFIDQLMCSVKNISFTICSVEVTFESWSSVQFQCFVVQVEWAVPLRRRRRPGDPSERGPLWLGVCWGGVLSGLPQGQGLHQETADQETSVSPQSQWWGCRFYF